MMKIRTNIHPPTTPPNVLADIELCRWLLSAVGAKRLVEILVEGPVVLLETFVAMLSSAVVYLSESIH